MQELYQYDEKMNNGSNYMVLRDATIWISLGRGAPTFILTRRTPSCNFLPRIYYETPLMPYH